MPKMQKKMQKMMQEMQSDGEIGFFFSFERQDRQRGKIIRKGNGGRFAFGNLVRGLEAATTGEIPR